MPNATDREAFDGLLDALSAAFDAEGRPGGSAAAAALRDAKSGPYHRVASQTDPGAILEAACALPGALAVAEQVLACRSLIDWTSWSGEGLAEDISANLYTAELVGPDGHVAADGVRVGLLVSAADTDYPVSSHSGEETYLVLSGVAEWTVDGGPYERQKPGALIHHPAWVPHGRRTLDQPFLGAWRWSGDLDLTSFRVSGASP